MMSFHSNICRTFNVDTYGVPSLQATSTYRHEVALHHIPKSKHYVLSVVSMNENICGAIFIHISKYLNFFLQKKNLLVSKCSVFFNNLVFQSSASFFQEQKIKLRKQKNYCSNSFSNSVDLLHL